MHKPPIAVRIIVLLIVLSTIGYFAFRSLKTTDSGDLKASGTIESVTVNVSPEMAGKVKEVLAAEGQPIKMGDPLLSLDDSLLTAQRVVAAAQADSARSAVDTAESALASAQVQYDLAFNTAVAQSDGLRTVDWFREEPGAFNLPLWYYSQTEQINAALTEVESAKVFLAEAESQLASVQGNDTSSGFIQAETDLAAARARYQVAKSLYDRVQNGLNSEELSRPQLIKVSRGDLFISGVSQDIRDSARQTYDDAKLQLDDVEAAYNAAASTNGAKEVLKARAEKSIAQERYYTALDYVLGLQTGESSAAVTVAQRMVDQAKAAMEQAQSSIKTAEANLALLDTQIRKLTIYAPMDGVILTRNAEPGEFVQPGAVALTMADLSNLTITVYVPDPRLNEIQLGQQATVTIDVVSGDSPTFAAQVIHIADEAEFTPRNVQTVEGRNSTVFAIKLKVTDNEGKLKIGMPADVTFSR